MIARWGNRRLFQIWSNVAGLAYMAAGQARPMLDHIPMQTTRSSDVLAHNLCQAWRPLGISMQQRSVQYIGAAVVLQVRTPHRPTDRPNF